MDWNICFSYSGAVELDAPMRDGRTSTNLAALQLIGAASAALHQLIKFFFFSAESEASACNASLASGGTHERQHCVQMAL
jgi:hypothetical protein